MMSKKKRKEKKRRIIKIKIKKCQGLLNWYSTRDKECDTKDRLYVMEKGCYL